MRSPSPSAQDMNKITPFLWFNNDAEAAADFYLSIFPNSRKLRELRATEAGPGPIGSLIVLDLELNGQPVTFINGGPAHQLTEAFSFSVQCETQAEIDRYWSQLTADGGSENVCGWLKDKFGLSWQITPARLTELIKNPKAMTAMMQMKKIDIAEIERAANS